MARAAESEAARDAVVDHEQDREEAILREAVEGADRAARGSARDPFPSLRGCEAAPSRRPVIIAADAPCPITSATASAVPPSGKVPVVDQVAAQPGARYVEARDLDLLARPVAARKEGLLEDAGAVEVLLEAAGVVLHAAPRGPASPRSDRRGPPARQPRRAYEGRRTPCGGSRRGALRRGPSPSRS